MISIGGESGFAVAERITYAGGISFGKDSRKVSLPVLE
jgi:hypothetical protein